MFKFVVQFLIMYLFWRSNAKAKGSWLTPSSFLIGIYLLSSACAIGVIINRGDYIAPFTFDCWYWIVEFLTFVILFLFPFRYFNEASQRTLKLPSLSTLNLLSTILICLSIFAILHYARTVIEIFSYGNLGDARELLYSGEEFVEASIFNTIASVSSSMYVFVLLLFFVYTAIGGHKRRRILLLIASMSEPVHIMGYVGRDGVVFWIFTFVFLFLFFAPYLEFSSIRAVRKIFIYGAGILLIPFLMISISRFGNTDGGTGDSIISYMGQSFVNGPLFFGINENQIPYSDGRAFPIFSRFIGYTPPIGERVLYEINEWQSWGFGTFLVALYRNLHFVGLIITCFIYNVLFIMIMKNKDRQINMHDLFIYLLYFQVIGEGVFYFKHSGPGGNLFIILCFILSIYFYIQEKNASPIYVYNKNINIRKSLF